MPIILAGFFALCLGLPGLIVFLYGLIRLLLRSSYDDNRDRSSAYWCFALGLIACAFVVQLVLWYISAESICPTTPSACG